ncbi:metal ABC transporter ATP-binding protein [Salidesulfovibrio onnuriiensis]|uniref:metal ABC transporter ATP-binding protein n=1 Tax=Salidesulfovibrio onnuriiensis TaxID=2583823 RepID=UPI0011C754F4|nr:metal ABC transporter ATP-binding protein [Salidesulfovibrio onnuriiensis]
MTVSEFLAVGPSVHFENVSLRLGGNSVLDRVSFSVQPGTIHCLVGPNGGGKTSLIRSLLGQMPHEGSIRIGWGTNQVTGYVPQTLDFGRSLPMTVHDFMAMICQDRPAFAGLRRDKRSLVRRALEQVNMQGKEERPFGALSGGERQRVLLAQALIPHPALLVLDEPAAGLDQEGAVVMHGLLQRLREQGTTIVMVHHDLAEVKGMADSVTCLNRQLLFSGPPETELTPEKILDIFTAKAA